MFETGALPETRDGKVATFDLLETCFMRSSKLLVFLCVLGVCVAFAAAPASAGITNVTTGATLFYDGCSLDFVVDFSR